MHRDAEVALRTLSDLRQELEEFVAVHVERALASRRSIG
jgi:hypothetical protein